MRTEKMQQEVDAAHYEFFVRKAFGCERGARRYPYADSHEWTALIIRHGWAKEGDVKKAKEYDKDFKKMITNFEKTIDYVLKKYDAKKKYVGLVEQFEHLKNELVGASTMSELMDIVNAGLSAYDEYGIEMQ